jgi:hypothetical protein
MNINFCCFIYGPDFDLYKCQIQSIIDLNLPNLGKLFLFYESQNNERRQNAFILNDEQKQWANKHNIVILEQPANYTPFSSFDHCMAKIKAYQQICKYIENEDDYLVDVDSDVLFVGDQALKDLYAQDFIGRLATDRIFPYNNRLQREWSQMSGVFLGMKIQRLRQICAFTDADYAVFRNEMIKDNIPFVHDCFTSYLMYIVCDQNKIKNISNVETNEYESFYLYKNFTNEKKSSVVHFASWGANFCGQALDTNRYGRNTRYDIPRILKNLGWYNE